MMRMGVSAIRLAAIPVRVRWTAMSDSETPRNGPKKEPTAVEVIAGRSAENDRATRGHQPTAERITTYPAAPASTRICVAAKGS